MQIESTRTIEIDQFVPRSEIDDRYINSPYYIAPDGKVGQDAFAVIRDTIAKMNMVAVGRVVLTRREHIIALEADEGEVWWDLPCAIPTKFAMKQPISRTFPNENPERDARSRYSYRPNQIRPLRSGAIRGPIRECLIDLLKKKEAGEKIEPAKEGPAPQVVNLMDALRASIDAEKEEGTGTQHPSAAAC